ncbi:thioredoxin [Streptococcus oricebi]|uniref:Thiol reductase thioredoxin n=1 Tax=Streptococcus oricebi TaxID=1547447 RepID=A0ABS5B407_9STRE|nr:thioredoxin [Streptococcus oricebi]MBP2623261.1 thiol reductase thioredoxin [Streptococcus oricebi]
MEEFTQNIKDLEVTRVERARQAIADKETATFFIGRKTCPYCRKFARTLAGVVAESKAHIYFINSEDPEQVEELAAFRSEYKIPTVPGFLHTEKGLVSVRCDSSMTAQEIKDFAGLA